MCRLWTKVSFWVPGLVDDFLSLMTTVDKLGQWLVWWLESSTVIRSLGEERFFPHLFVTLPGDHTYTVRWFGWMEVEELPGTDLGAMTTVTVFLWHFCQSPGFGFWFWTLLNLVSWAWIALVDNGNSIMWNKLPPGSPPVPTNLSSFLRIFLY